jgi:hypothetical protein
VSLKSLLRHHPSGCQPVGPVGPTSPTHVAALSVGPTGAMAGAARPGPMSCDAPPHCAAPPHCVAPPHSVAPQLGPLGQAAALGWAGGKRQWRYWGGVGGGGRRSERRRRWLALQKIEMSPCGWRMR